MICLSVNQLSKSFLSNQLLCLFTTSQPAPFGFFNLFFFFLHYLQHKSCDHLLTIWWGSLLFQRRGSCVVLKPWLLPTSCLIADLIPMWWLCNVSQVWSLSLTDIAEPSHIYSRVLILQWPEGQQAADYLTGNTSCIVLNFAWSHWPGYFFIIHGNGRKAAKWIHTHASI